MLKIGDFSKLARISIRMLRYYDENGLLQPKTIDRFTGYRYYGEDQLPQAERIRALREMGFEVSTVQRLLCSGAGPELLFELLQEQKEQLQQQAAQLDHRMLLLETAIKRLREDETTMEYGVTLKTLPPRFVASVRDILPAYAEEGRLWNTLMQETSDQGLQPADGGYTLAVYHDKEYKDSDVDVEIQAVVKGQYHDTQHVVFKTEPAVQFASATYKGGYDQLTTVNHAVANWVRDNGYQFDGPMFCIYHVSRAETDDPNELVTEVCFPVRKP